MINSYCYPVLSKESDNYVKSSEFDCNIAKKLSANKIILDVEFILTDPTLLQMVDDGSAVYSLLLKCSKSSYRKHHQFKENNAVLEINGSDIDVAGRIEVMPTLITTCDLKNYENENLNVEYYGAKISIPKFGFLAIAPIQLVTAKRHDPFRTVESVIKFDEYDSHNPFATRNRYDEEGNYVTVFLSKDMRNKYNELPKNIKEIFSVVYIVPVIADIIQRYWINERTTSEYRWHDILSEKIKLDYGDKPPENAYKAAMRIFEGFSEEVLDVIYEEFNKKTDGGEFDYSRY